MIADPLQRDQSLHGSSNRLSRMARTAVAVLFLLGFLLPANGLSRFDGLPLNSPLVVLGVFFVLPTVLVLDPALISRSRLFRVLALVVVGVRIFLFGLGDRTGVCLQPLQYANEMFGRIPTYEGIWNRRCFVQTHPITDPAEFPLEYHNQRAGAPDGPDYVFVHFYLRAPSEAQSLVIELGDAAFATTSGFPPGPPESLQFRRGPLFVPLGSKASEVQGVLKIDGKQPRFAPALVTAASCSSGFVLVRFVPDPPHIAPIVAIVVAAANATRG